MSQSENTNILIAGAGPAGTATSLFLSSLKIHHTIIDKATFPRDKICGDALSGKVVHILNKLDKSMIKDFSAHPQQYTGSYGICFFSPNGRKLEIPFSMKPGMLKNAPGFISRRINFDNYLFSKLDSNYATIKQATTLKDISRKENKLVVQLENGKGSEEKMFDIVVGAEGDRSIVAKKLDPLKKNPDNYCAALRAYYTGVSGMHESNFIELHFIKELLPGYFWIFPMNDGSANVGIGMLSSVVSEKKINLRSKMLDIIQNHPEIKKRFANATLEETIDGWGLPLGSARRSLSGDNYLLTGDAGSLIDPFTGEGIGNALYSGMLAARTIAEAVKEKQFGKDFLSRYEKELYKNLNDELRISHGIQKLSRKAWLFNYVVKKAATNETLRETITCMFDDLDIRARLRQPSFYFKLLFGK